MQQSADTISLKETLSKKQLVIIVNENNCFGSFQCKTGLNVDVDPFSTYTSIVFIGIYLTEINNMLYGISATMCKFAYVTIPEDARICVCKEKNGIEWYRVDKFNVVSDFMHVRNYYKFDDSDFCKSTVKQHPRVIGLIETKTDELYKLAIESDYRVIIYIPAEHRTFELCMHVVKKNGLLVKSLKSTAMSPEQYIEVWLEAAKGNCNVIDDAPYDWRPILWRRYNEL
jgi:hypothetical protein